ncbi:amidophosphoribosyltransferase [Parvularcula maris]|uniref:Amidophosphoribosyltransferase n=1 Tax=Parvularcula maris TaxID=2965077 RepID=A0A9X2RKW0_9PROT|nr:amidophosphoribosyltransferase [Parvularcula maris]MCQ8186183.1 amidophosphoribosyltransferase [Parvularcula maris]
MRQVSSFLRREQRALAERPPLPRALNEECGVFGIIGHDGPAAPIVALGLHALQHRGQEAAGIITHSEDGFHADRQLGLVADHFHAEEVLAKLPGRAGIGHTRYSTAGDGNLRNVQPLFAEVDRGGIAVAHNGNLTNNTLLRRELISKGSIFHTSSDSELFVQLTALSRGITLADKVIDAARTVEGAFALTVLTANHLIGVRDPVGIRPLVLGRLGDAYVLSSESCAFDLIGAEFVRDVEPGEVVICGADGSLTSRRLTAEGQRPRPCIFELIYFARPNSFVDGESVYDLRKRLGRTLAEEAPVEADCISPIPDSGVPAAIGFAQASGVPYEMALIRSHYSGRTFIQPDQKVREKGVARKHSANPGVVKGKRVVLVDDSLVRGTTSTKIIQMMREAGAKEVHLRIACPPIIYPDFYGIDTPSQKELMAASHSVEEMRREIGADSLAFLSLDGLYRALGKGPRDGDAPAFTDHCFTGDYPTALRDQEAPSSERHAQLSLLREA